MSERGPVSALGGVARAAGLAVRIEEATGLGMILLRADFTQERARAAAEQALGLAAPAPLSQTAAGARALVWMAPDEFLLILPRAEAAAALAQVGAALAGLHHLALDVSDARALFRLTGAGAREVVAKGMPVDLSRTAFGLGAARRSHLGPVAAAVWVAAETPETLELVCARSVAGYVFDWLVVAAQEGTLPGVL